MPRDIVEDRLKIAVENITPDVLDKILADCGTAKAQVYVINDTKPNRAWIRTIAALAAVFALVATGGYFNLTKVNSLIMLDVNPSIELTINKNDRVLTALAKNEDALKILDGMDFKNVDIDVAINALIGSMLKYGYIKESANSVLLSVESEDSVKREELQRALSSSISRQLNMLNGAVLSQNLADNTLIETLADKNGISYGKAALVQKILNENAHLAFEDLARLSINELVLLVGSKNIQSDGLEARGSASDTAYIGADSAARIAFEHGGISSEETVGLHIEMDYDGHMLYEVEFFYNDTEYDYEIDAQSGEIIEYDYERATANGEIAQHEHAAEHGDHSKDDFISEDKAVELVTEHAGLDSYTDLKVKLDKDDGIYLYEVEFKDGKVKYEYEVNAVTGEIVSWETDD